MRKIADAIRNTVIFALLFPGIAWSNDIEVFTYWISPTEAAAFSEIERAFATEGGSLRKVEFPNDERQRDEFLRRSSIGLPPAVFHLTIGPYSQELADAGLFISLQEVGHQGRWADVMPPQVMDAISVDGEIFFAPAGIHIENWLWIDKSALDAHNLPIPVTWDEVLAVGRKLKSLGLVPIAITKSEWMLFYIIRMVIASIIQVEDRPRAAEITWDEIIDAPGFPKALETLVNLRDLATLPEDRGTWIDAIDDVVEGRSAMYFMGDWAKAEFTLKGRRIGDDIICVRPPGSDWLVHIVVDAFGMPSSLDPSTRAEQERFARTVVDPAVQVAFATKKGAIPVRTDVDLGRLDICAREGLALLADPGVVKTRLNPTASPLKTTRYTLVLLDTLSDPNLTAEAALARIAAIRATPD